MTITLAALSDWHDTWALVRGLWPKWEPTKEQADLWEDTLRPLSQERVRRAAKSAATGRWREPVIDDVVNKYRGINVKTSQHAYTKPPHTMAEANAEVADMRRDLLKLDAEQLARGVTEAQPNLEMLGELCSGVDLADPATWPNGLVGFVWAAVNA